MVGVMVIVRVNTTQNLNPESLTLDPNPQSQTEIAEGHP